MVGQRSHSLHTMDRAIPPGDDVNQALDLIVERVRSLTGAGEVMALDWHDGALIPRATSGIALASMAVVLVDDAQSLEGWVARHNEPVFISDVRREPRLRSSIAAQRGLTSIAAVPMVSETTVVGVLEVRGTRAIDFARHAALLAAMADIAVAASLQAVRRIERPWSIVAPGFVRAITHDLKSPLTAIRGHAQLLQRRAARSGAPNENDVTAAVTIMEQVQRMTRMLDGLADAGLVEEGSLVLHMAPLDIVALVQSAVDALRTASSASSAQRVVVTAPEQEMMVDGDAPRLIRAVETLVGNALRRSAANGCVSVTVVRQGTEIVVAVQDDDASKAPADLPHIFDWAYQGAADQRTAFDLALYSSQRIIEAHHGRLWATSAPDSGSTFAFTLPAGAHADPAPAG